MSTNNNIPALNGLRGFAALLVVASHTSGANMFFLPNVDFAGTGKSGVFLFFILSAFLLVSQFNHTVDNAFDRKSLTQYGKRRFYRIYPFYSLYLLGGLVSTALLMFVGIQGIGVPFTLDFQEFVGHLLLLEGKGVTWSIAVEFKFYFVLPFLAFALIKLRSLGESLPYLLIAALFLGTSFISPQSESLTNDARLLPYIPVFLFGALLAELQINTPKFLKSARRAVSVATILGVIGLFIQTPSIYSMYHPVEFDHFAKNFIQFSICWTVVLYCAITNSGILARFFENKILQFFGALSFSIYLIHPVYIGLLNKSGIDTPINAWIVLALSTLSAYMAYKFIELPGVRLGKSSRILVQNKP